MMIKRWQNAVARPVAIAALVLLTGLLPVPNLHAEDPFIGEVMCGGWSFCPNGWLECNGQQLPIAEYDALFSLIGTTYGGDGQYTFALPNIQGRTMVHQGTGSGLTTRTLGQTGGAETVTLTTNQLPSHTHGLSVHSGAEKSASPTGKIPGTTTAATPVYNSTATSAKTLPSNALSQAGGSQPHNNLQPYLVMKCCISWAGIYPSQN
ncbi:Microcystin-dependent protein [Trichlorobacter thiogenes]|uniref:Microcystin-dependent protein n=1 Tax=Trichlorobacter thiogenes TaxID=115783 RepID=A0A1T4QGV9_9BACT|nr:tail fiber protein [Trichlorobacter thiogenes]SKA02955.1 Microcystin-dependent protein [Trichlorobacter thiogenes]